MGKKEFATKISVSALGTPDKDGYLTKQGGAIKTWKKRWFVLKGDCIYYFRTQKDTEQTGEIKLESTSACNPEPGYSQGKSKNRFYFSVGTPNRTFYIYTDSEETMKQWVDKISKAIENVGGGGSSSSSSTSTTSAPAAASTPASDPAPKENNDPAPSTTTEDNKEVEKRDNTPVTDTSAGTSSGGDSGASSGGKITNASKISRAKGVIPFLQDEDSKVLEFWQIWSESIPPKEDLQTGMTIEYHVSTSANMQKLTWRTAGPQNIFIQKMVDFFWNVGAPESEIDRLNDVGALINPIKIGSWIDMSAKGGMDGGWYFPVDIPLKMADRKSVV